MLSHLNIFLIKAELTKSEQIVNTEICNSPIDIPIAGYGSAQLFVRNTPDTPPRWTALFRDYLDPNVLAVPGVSAVLFIRVSDRCFALTFGHGGRFLLRDDVHEERFGLLCTLNSVDPKSFRCVDVQSLDAIDSHTRIQSGEETTSDQFGLDVEQDMLKAIVGTPLNYALGSRMTGSDSLSVSVKLDLSDLPFLLDEYRKKFEADLNARDHQWVNNISMTKSSAVIATLEAKLNERLAERKFDGIWLSIPEIIEWTAVQGFIYTHGSNKMHPDINLQGFLTTVDSKTPITLDLLRERTVYCADSDFKKVFKSWQVFKCMYAEIDNDDGKYLLNDGKWFKVATDFVAKTNADFADIAKSKLKLPEYKGGGEGAYNASVAAEYPKRYALLDAKIVVHGGSRGKIEICDLLSIDRELIHVKMYGKSAVFSHLISQGFVSGQLIQIDPDFRQKVREQLAPPFIDLIEIDKRPLPGEFTIVFAVISDAEGEDLYLPFFSRVNLNNTAKILRGFGFKVELLKIAFDDNYAKTVKIPPKRKAKSKAI